MVASSAVLLKRLERASHTERANFDAFVMKCARETEHTFILQDDGQRRDPG